MSGIPIDIILFAIIAVLIFYKYTSILGSKDDESESRRNGLEAESYSGKVIIFPGNKPDIIQEGTPPSLEQSLALIARANNRFDRQEFINASKVAFKLILAAFTAGDMSEVSHLLSSTVAKKFKSAIKDREASTQLQLEELINAQLIEASLIGPTAEITVQFTSTQTLIQHGFHEGTEQVIDLWVFSRNIYADSPVWALADITAATSSVVFDVILKETGPNKVNVVKIIREVTGLGLKEAKNLVENTPKTIKEAVNKDEADEIKDKLAAQGAVAEIK